MGASIAGLLAARALSPHFRKVTIVERDPLSTALAPGLVCHKANTFMFCCRRESRLWNVCSPAARWNWFGTARSPLITHNRSLHHRQSECPGNKPVLNTLAQTRPFLEHHVRRWVSELPNVEILHYSTVQGLLWDQAKGACYRKWSLHPEGRPPGTSEAIWRLTPPAATHDCRAGWSTGVSAGA